MSILTWVIWLGSLQAGETFGSLSNICGSNCLPNALTSFLWLNRTWKWLLGQIRHWILHMNIQIPLKKITMLDCTINKFGCRFPLFYTSSGKKAKCICQKLFLKYLVIPRHKKKMLRSVFYYFSIFSLFYFLAMLSC